MMANDDFPNGILFISLPHTEANGDVDFEVSEVDGTDFSKVRIIYKPRAGYVGVDDFTHTVAGNMGASSTATIRVTVKPPVV